MDGVAAHGVSTAMSRCRTGPRYASSVFHSGFVAAGTPGTTQPGPDRRRDPVTFCGLSCCRPRCAGDQGNHAGAVASAALPGARAERGEVGRLPFELVGDDSGEQSGKPSETGRR